MGKIVDRKSHNRNKPKGGRTRVRKHEVKLSDFKRKPTFKELSLMNRIILEESDTANSLNAQSKSKLFIKNNAEARIAHFEKTTKKQRSKDYQSNEPIAQNLEQYIGDPIKFDWRGVDMAIPKYYTLFLEVKPFAGIYTAQITLVNDNDGEAGYSHFHIDPTKNNLQIKKLEVYSNHRGKQLSHHIRRQLMLFADEYNLEVITLASGNEGSPLSNKRLKEYYKSFGKRGHDYTYRPPHK